MTGDLPSDVADVLGVLLDGDDPVHVALRAQIPHLRVSERCTCGCGTAYFDLDTTAVQPAPATPSILIADAQICLENGDRPGEVLVFAQGGYLSWLEVCSWSDTTEVTLALAQRMLCR
ncbi:hypothetical protein ACFC26_16760 [Kitasatospora purpeofusca]|uniref:hypothetical protein n=1 Tax=Kitasatospora purpeofusca TaxID=67352 RepID=UPI0035DA7388